MNRWIVVVVLAFAAAAGARQPSASIDLTGVKLQNGLNQSRSSAPNTITSAKRYSYSISGMVKGSSGLLAILYPNPIPLAQLLESFGAGSSEVLDGYACNPAGTHPVVFVQQAMGGPVVIGTTNATVSFDLAVGIDGANLAYFSMTNVVVSPSFLIGTATFTSGTALLTRIACPPDMNGDGVLNLADFGSFQTSFAIGDEKADFNCDGALNLADFGAFQTAFAVGCP